MKVVSPFQRNTGQYNGMCVCVGGSWSCEKAPTILSQGG